MADVGGAIPASPASHVPWRPSGAILLDAFLRWTVPRRRTMPSPTKRRLRRALGAALGLATLVLAAVPVHAGSAEFVYARLCRKTFSVQGRTYALKRLGLVTQCADKFLKCELLNEIEGVNPTDCRKAVTDACTKRLGSAPDTALGKAGLRFELKTGAVCETAFFSYVDVLSTGPGGLWFGNDSACASAIDLPSFLDCLRDEVDARTDELVSQLKPRTALLFDNAGLGDDFPHLVRPPFVDQVVSATAAGSGLLVDPGTIVVAAGSALRFTVDAATIACGPSSNNGRVEITVGSGPTAVSYELDEPYTGEVAEFGPWIATATIPYTIELKDGSCDDQISGIVSVP